MIIGIQEELKEPRIGDMVTERKSEIAATKESMIYLKKCEDTRAAGRCMTRKHDRNVNFQMNMGKSLLKGKDLQVVRSSRSVVLK